MNKWGMTLTKNMVHKPNWMRTQWRNQSIKNMVIEAHSHFIIALRLFSARQIFLLQNDVGTEYRKLYNMRRCAHLSEPPSHDYDCQNAQW